ncbi:hypothetical protein [Nocardia sp. NPDC059239]|uniref:hypothetical protein n=1 Tax=unclassified Nocardia TaxID=2637762 RepID=UPI00367B0F6C
MPDNTIRALLEDAWDDGNAAGLDGWVGPGRGTEPVDEDAILRRGRATKNALANLEGWRPPARVIDTTEIEAMPTGTLLRSADGDVASVDHGGDGEWLGHNTKVHFLGFVTRWSECVMHLPADQWTVLWQPEVNDHA